MKIVLTLCGVVLGGMLSMSVARAEVAPGAPTILVPTSQAHTSSVKPVIAGVTQTGTQVDVYIDQQFNGHATVQASSAATAAWTYTPFLNLNQGWHTVTVKAQNAAGGRSEVSAPAYIYIDLLVPQPTLLTPVVNAETTNLQPWIVGLSKGGMTLNVWIDGVLNGQVAVGGTRTETESFKYQPFLPLSVGTHVVSVVAVDPFGGRARPISLKFTVQTTSVVATSTSDTSSSLSTEPAVDASSAPTQSTDSQTSDTDAAVTPDTENVNAVNGEASATPESSKRENVLTTIGWVLLALVAIGMITRGRSKKPEVSDQLMKIDTSNSTPHVEVIRKPPTTPLP